MPIQICKLLGPLTNKSFDNYNLTYRLPIRLHIKFSSQMEVLSLMIFFAIAIVPQYHNIQCGALCTANDGFQGVQKAQ